MILRLDPAWPIVWRTPTSIQIGVDPPRVFIDDITQTQERVLAALEVGISESGLAMIARGDTRSHREFMERLAPAMAQRVARERVPSVTICGSGSFAREAARLLTALHFEVDIDDADGSFVTEPRIAIIVGHFVLHPRLHSRWLRQDVVHVPVVFSDTTLEIGPVVQPGNGPCLVCLELHRRDADPSWIAIATQLLGRPVATESALMVAEGAAALCRIVVGALSKSAQTPTSLRIDVATGITSHHEWSAHPDCGCRGIAPLVTARATAVPQESDLGAS